MSFIKDQFGEKIEEGDWIVVKGEVYQVSKIEIPSITDPTNKNPQVPLAIVRIVRDLTMMYNANKNCVDVFRLSYKAPAGEKKAIVQ